MEQNIKQLKWLLTHTLIRTYRDGKLYKEFYTKNGILDGACKTFYISGELFSIEFYKNGECFGLFRKYWTNGQIKQSFYYGKKPFLYLDNSPFKEWDKNGKLTKDSIIKIPKSYFRE